jgi:CCR4-NOT transcription complex subunit 7/8
LIADISSKILQGYDHVALDTEFPGVVVEESDYYGADVCTRNANATSLIELGLSLFNRAGERPPGKSTFVFHFRWSKEGELFNPKSIELLKRSGLNFTRNALEGVSHEIFSELFVRHLARNRRVVWLTFHCSHDVAYLQRLALRSKLSNSPADFKRNAAELFPNLVDLKTVAERVGVMGGLEKLAAELGVARIGKSHTSGSDARLTGDVYFRAMWASGSKSRVWQEALQTLTGVMYGIK